MASSTSRSPATFTPSKVKLPIKSSPGIASNCGRVFGVISFAPARMGPTGDWRGCWWDSCQGCIRQRRRCRGVAQNPRTW